MVQAHTADFNLDVTGLCFAVSNIFEYGDCYTDTVDFSNLYNFQNYK